jgi:ribonucleoside-diphosphate reductase alpha chain
MKQLPKNAQEVMVRRYAMRNEKGLPVETTAEILERTARVVAEAENNYRDGITPQAVQQKFAELMKDFRFVPNGRTLANAGKTQGQLANCFVLPIEDEMGKTEDGIFSILRKAVLILQSGGGVGFSFGRIRPKGDTAGKGKATGPVSFLKVFDTAFWVIGQGGGRRSACMAVLPVHHPDIYDFIRCKEQEGVIEHFNISVGVTDAFMEAVEKDTDFDLINPRDNKVWRTVRARDLFTEIVTFAHHNGEPGVLFLDAANRENPVPHQYTLEATNPCGEQFLGPYENCCMASVNLAEHVTETRNQKPETSKKKTGSRVTGIWWLV